MHEQPTYSLEDHICHQTYALERAFNRAYQQAFAGSGMTYPKFIVLKTLEEKGPVPISALSAYVGVETNSLSPLLKKMAGFGAVTRTRPPEDERQVVIEITAFGRDILRVAEKVATEIYGSLGLDPEDAAQLVSALSKLRNAVARADPQPIVMPERQGD